jgi:hypothetical protein
MTQRVRGKRVRETYWIGLVDEKPHFYTQQDYYDGVVHGDLFKSRRAARKCYERVVRVELLARTRKG